MTPTRPNPHDTPKRETTWRRAKIRTRTGRAAEGYHYIVDFPQEGTELAFSYQRHNVNATVHARWRNESAIWWIPGALLPVIFVGHRFGIGDSAIPWHSPGIFEEDLPDWSSIEVGGFNQNIWPVEGGYIYAATVFLTTPNVGAPVATFIPFDGADYPLLLAGAVEGPQVFPSGSFPIVGYANHLSPDGEWLLSNVAPTNAVDVSAAAFHWDGTAWSPGVFCPPGIYINAGAGNAQWDTAHWHPEMTHALLGWAHAVEWTGSAWGTVIGQPPGLPSPQPRLLRVMNAAWWSPGGNIALVTDGTVATRDTKSLRAWAWTGSGWGSELVLPDRASGGPDVDSTYWCTWVKGNQYLATFGVDLQAPFLTSTPVQARLSLHPWSEVTGYGPATDTIEWTATIPPGNLGVYHIGARQLAPSPDGEYLAFCWEEGGNEGVNLTAVKIEDDGTFGERWDVPVGTGVFTATNIPGVGWHLETYT